MIWPRAWMISTAGSPAACASGKVLEDGVRARVKAALLRLFLRLPIPPAPPLPSSARDLDRTDVAMSAGPFEGSADHRALSGLLFRQASPAAISSDLPRQTLH